ncbi:Hypothetical protein FKW44_025216, partial [Caligus rogercresseyi]
CQRASWTSAMVTLEALVVTFAEEEEESLAATAAQRYFIIIHISIMRTLSNSSFTLAPKSTRA